jgi:hypothetical protein
MVQFLLIKYERKSFEELLENIILSKNGLNGRISPLSAFEHYCM